MNRKTRYKNNVDLGNNNNDFSVSTEVDTSYIDNIYCEQKVLAAWNQILGKNISTLNEDNFFEQGGDSLSAIRTVNIVNNDLKIKLSPVALFSYPKLNDFTRYALDHINNKTKCEEGFYDQL